MKISLKIIFALLLLSSCKLAVHIISKQAAQSSGPIDTEGMTGIPSPSNDDNKIYITNRSFIYEVDQCQNKRKLKFELEMLVIPGSFNLNESKIKYKYRYNPKDLTEDELIAYGYDSIAGFRPEYTSFTESATDMDFHPPRSKSLECLEAAPFPDIPYPIKKGIQSKAFLFIPRGSWGKLSGSKINWIYKIDSVTYIKDTTPYSCIVNAVADSKKGGHNTLQMHFNIDSGFTKWSYRFQDSTAIDFILKEIR